MKDRSKRFLVLHSSFRQYDTNSSVKEISQKRLRLQTKNYRRLLKSYIPLYPVKPFAFSVLVGGINDPITKLAIASSNIASKPSCAYKVISSHY